MTFNTAQKPAKKRAGAQNLMHNCVESRLKITEYPAMDPAYPVYFQMDSPAMKDCGLLSGDILVVDRTLTPVNNSIVVAFVEDCFYCRRYEIVNNRPVLTSDDDGPLCGEIPQICGVVTSICRHTLPEVLRSGNYRRVCTL